MSYSSPNPRHEGTLANGDNSSATKVTWDLNSEQGRAVMVLTVTTSVPMTLRYETARTAEDLASPPLSLPHRIDEEIPANETQVITVSLDPSQTHGQAWLINNSGSSGNYRLDGGRRAHS